MRPFKPRDAQRCVDVKGPGALHRPCTAGLVSARRLRGRRPASAPVDAAAGPCPSRLPPTPNCNVGKTSSVTRAARAEEAQGRWAGAVTVWQVAGAAASGRQRHGGPPGTARQASMPWRPEACRGRRQIRRGGPWTAGWPWPISMLALGSPRSAARGRRPLRQIERERNRRSLAGRNGRARAGGLAYRIDANPMPPRRRTRSAPPTAAEPASTPPAGVPPRRPSTARSSCCATLRSPLRRLTCPPALAVLYVQKGGGPS